jgi:Uma2 family endonuclease
MTVIDLAMLTPERLRPLKRVEYDRLVELGYFEDEKIELLEGHLVAMSPQGAEHTYVITKLNMLFAQAIGTRALVQVQGPFAASDDSEPEPDLALIANEDFSHQHPAHAFLLVEVAQSSLRKDRLIKAALYARAGIAEYWIVNLADRVIEVHRAARDDRYTSVTAHGPGDTISPEAFSDIRVPIADLLPR